MEGALPPLYQLTDARNPDVSMHYAQLHTFNNTAMYCHFTATVTTSSRPGSVLKPKPKPRFLGKTEPKPSF